MNSLFLVATIALQLASQTPGGSVGGRIVNGNGTAAANVRVAAMSASEESASVSMLVAFAVTDRSGRYLLENVEPGVYYITAGMAAQPTFYPGVAARTAAKTVTVVPGVAVGDIDFNVVTPLPSAPTVARAAAPAAATPAPTFTLGGRVVLPPGQQLPPDGRVWLGPGAAAAIKPDGSFEFMGIRTGSYGLRTSLSFLMRPVDVVVTDRNITGVQIVIPATARVTAKIDVEGGGILGTAGSLSLSIKSVASPQNAISVSSTHTFTMDLPEGDYRVMPETVPVGYSLKSITAGSVDLLNATLKISRAAPPLITVTLSPNSAASNVAVSSLRELTGRVTVEGNQDGPLVGLRFSSTLTSGASIVVDASLPESTFKVMLPEGEFKVDAFLPSLPGRPASLGIKAVTYGQVNLLAERLVVSTENSPEIRIVLGAVAIQ